MGFRRGRDRGPRNPEPPCEEGQYERHIGIPRGRSLPMALGMYTRRAGPARQQGWPIIVATSSPRAVGVLTRTLSTPGVSLPRFCCVARLTLRTVLDQLRSISF